MTMRMQGVLAGLAGPVITTDGELEGSEEKSQSDAAVLAPAIVVHVVFFLACVPLLLGVWYRSKKLAAVQQQCLSSI